jgi:hypothetical protein
MSIILMAQKTLTPITRADLVIWAVLLLGGDQKRIDTEDVAVKAFQLDPKSFCWRKHPDQINLELVRVNLSNAKKPENGAFLTGSGRTGWSLTRKGLAWIRTARSPLKSLGASEPQRRASSAGSIDSSRRDRERKRILALPAWTRWANGDKSVVLAEAREVYRLDSYSTLSVREAKLTRLRAMFGDDEQLSPFLAHLSDEIDKEDQADDPSR